MGRFKIYDPNQLINVLNDSNYGKCLLCERKLKNIMGNIKRHYEQMHSVYVNANHNKTKKSRKKSSKFSNKKDCKINIGGKTLYVEKQNGLLVKTKKERETPKANISPVGCSNGHLIDAPLLPISESTEAREECKSNSKKRKYVEENPVERTSQAITSSFATEEQPKYSSVTLPVLQEIKLKQENGKQEIISKTQIKHQLPLHYSNIKENKRDEGNEEIQIPCYAFVNNIQIDSADYWYQLEFLKCIVETKAHVNIPLKNFQKADTFQKALQNWKPNFQFNYSSQTIGDHIDRMTKKLRQEVTKLVANRIIYLKLDITNSMGDNIMLVNIQFINNFKLKVITLSALKLSDENFASHLKNKVLAILERYQIDISRVYAIIKDNCNNVKEFHKVSGIGKQISASQGEREDLTTYSQNIDYCKQLCQQFPGHAIHYVANDIIKKLNENISQSRDSAKKLRQQFHRLNIKEVPILDNNSSWFSVFDMIESLLKVREIVESNNLMQVEIDWQFAIKFVTSFRPIVDTALILQTNDLFIMGDFYREWLLCETKLEELVNSNELALYLLDAFRKQKSHFIENTSFLAALYLDPRYCYMGSMYLSDKQKEIAISHLLQIFEKLKSINEALPLIDTNDVNFNDRYAILEAHTATSCKTDAEKSSFFTLSLSNVDCQWVKESLEQLQFEERLPFIANILDYWNMIKYKSPVLAKIAEVALAAPATQATINRSLNASSITLLRHKISDNTDNVEQLLLLKLNQDLVDKITLEN